MCSKQGWLRKHAHEEFLTLLAEHHDACWRSAVCHQAKTLFFAPEALADLQNHLIGNRLASLDIAYAAWFLGCEGFGPDFWVLEAGFTRIRPVGVEVPLPHRLHKEPLSDTPFGDNHFC